MLRVLYVYRKREIDDCKLSIHEIVGSLSYPIRTMYKKEDEGHAKKN
jgi:hypothetical protein